MTGVQTCALPISLLSGATGLSAEAASSLIGAGVKTAGGMANGQDFGDALTGAATGAALGYLGGQAVNGMDSGQDFGWSDELYTDPNAATNGAYTTAVTNPDVQQTSDYTFDTGTTNTLGDTGSDWATGSIGDRKSTRLNSSHIPLSRMPSSA